MGLTPPKRTSETPLPSTAFRALVATSWSVMKRPSTTGKLRTSSYSGVTPTMRVFTFSRAACT